VIAAIECGAHGRTRAMSSCWPRMPLASCRRSPARRWAGDVPLPLGLHRAGYRHRKCAPGRIRGLVCWSFF